MSMKRAFVAILLFTFCATASARPKPPVGWKRYSGAWFDVFYPQAFTPVPAQKSSTSSEGVDAVTFLSPVRDAEFYVFSPQWNGHVATLDIDPRRERLTSKKVALSDYKTGDGQVQKDAVEDIWLGITALDGSYVRFVHQHSDGVTNTTHTFGIKCKDTAAYSRYRADYDSFRKSLVQYAD